MIRISLKLTAIALVLVSFGSARGGITPTAITECGAVFLDPTEAFLVADLDCSTWEFVDDRPVVKFLKRGTLDLRGFTLRGPVGGASTSNTMVECWESCTIVGGGGSIIGGHFGATAAKRITVVDAILRDTTRRAIGGARRAELENVFVIGTGTDAVTASLRVVVRNSTVANNGGYPQPDTGLVQKTSAVIFAEVIRVFDSTIVDNAWAGIEGGRAYVRDSVIANNGTFDECGVTRNCRFDVGTRRRPRVRDSNCGTSLDMTSCACNGDSEVTPETSPEFHNWGVCSLD